MKASVDPDVCIGCGLCAEICPEIFRMEDDKAVAYVYTMPDKHLDSAKKAAADCPVDAIAID